MNKLLAQNRLRRLTAVIVAQWAARGVSVSPVALQRHGLLAEKLHGGRSWPLRWTDNLFGEVRDFAVGSDMLTIFGWDVREEPAVLVSADKLLAKLSSIHDLYPDGFILISDVKGKALIVDFDDEEGTHLDVIELPVAAA